MGCTGRLSFLEGHPTRFSLSVCFRQKGLSTTILQWLISNEQDGPIAASGGGHSKLSKKKNVTLPLFVSCFNPNPITLQWFAVSHILLVLGANGRTGLELVKQGLERNYRVTAFVRDDKLLLEDSALRKNQNLLIVRGSPTSQSDLDRCVESQDVIINVIGARLMTGDSTISSHSQVVLNNAMKKHGKISCLSHLC